MGFQRKIKFFLVHTLKISNAQAQTLLDNGQVEVNGKTVTDNCLIDRCSEIKVKGRVIREAKVFRYYKFYKPAGYQSTLSENVANNLSGFFKEQAGLAIAGRLDMNSEGLLLISDDGNWIERLCNPSSGKEKEYLVRLDKSPDENFFIAFRSGVNIGDYLTRPCICEQVDGSTIRVVLTEGKNRQIRRMCWRLGYAVTRLKRIRIDKYELGALQLGEIQTFTPD